MSISFSINDVCTWTDGQLLAGDQNTLLSGVSIDSRSMGSNQIFVAIHGTNYDAHRFLEDAISQGAIALLIAKGRVPLKLPKCGVIAVTDTTRSLGALATGHREKFTGPLIAITGSNGKTTTKEMCAAILSTYAPCLKNRGNLNNEFGLPLTLLEREARHQGVVVEIGMNHPGEIANLSAIARPNIGVITNVGTAHIEHLGSQEEIALEKGTLIASLPHDGIAVLNADDPWVLGQGARASCRISTFGFSSEADVRADQIVARGKNGFSFDLMFQKERCPVQVAGLGESTVINALAAAAAALAANIPIDKVASGLALYRPIGGRMEMISVRNNITLINDAYNANPQSMNAALHSLARLKGESRGIAVLGDMGELGTITSEAHFGIGRLVANLDVDFLFALGQWSKHTAKGALESGMDRSRIWKISNYEETCDVIEKILQRDDWVLVKGSRSMHMESIIEKLAEGLT